MDIRIQYVSTSNNCVFFQIDGHMSASEVKGILLKEGFLEIDAPMTPDIEARKYFTENPNSIVRLYFISKFFGVEQYQHSIKPGDPDSLKEQILEKGIARTFTGNPSLVNIAPGDFVVMRKYTGR